MELSLAMITDFISPLILLACLAVGYILKNVIPSEKIDKWIPLIVGCLGIVLAVWNFGFIDLTIIVTGAISGLASSGLYETFKGLIEGIQEAVNKSNSTEEETIILDETIEGIDGGADTHVVISEVEEKISSAQHKKIPADNIDSSLDETILIDPNSKTISIVDHKEGTIM